MPELARFFGLVISMFYMDHNPPHIHVEPYARRRGHSEWMAEIDIRTGRVIAGEIPSGYLSIVKAWLNVRRQALMIAWDRASQGRPPGKIPPPRVR